MKGACAERLRFAWLAAGHGVWWAGAECLCPLLIVAIVLDSLSFCAWTVYEGRDPQIYAAIARFWSDGLLPYRDAYDFKPPLIYAALRAGYAVWGYDAESLRRVLLIVAGSTSLVLYVGLRRARCLVAAPLAALALMTIVAAEPRPAGYQSPEPLAALFAAGACGFAALHQRSNRWCWAVAAGAALGAAVLGKQPAVFYAIPLGLQLVLWGGPGGWVGRSLWVGSRAALAATGVLCVVGATAIYFARYGGLGALYEAVIVDAGHYGGVDPASLLSPSTWLSLLGRPTAAILPEVLGGRDRWPLLAGVLALVPLAFLRPSRWGLVGLAWIAAAYMGAVVGPRPEAHYALITWPAQALALGLACELALPAEHGGAAGRLVGGVVVAFLVLGGIWRTHYLPGRYNTHPQSDDAHTIARRIAAAAQPGDTLFVEDQPFDIYAFAGLAPATRMIYWNAPRPDAIRTRQRDLERLPPFVVVTPDSYAYLHEGSLRPNNPEFVPFAAVMHAHYREWFVTRSGTIYLREDRVALAEAGGWGPDERATPTNTR
jgi:4-amino-4-deoxy-L-arabinose transferase-like glycosyltransferase